MKYVIKVCTADEYLIVTFSPMEATRTPDIDKATYWKCRDCAETVASEFCAVEVIGVKEKKGTPDPTNTKEFTNGMSVL